MSHALRYGLTVAVLIAGTTSACYFRDSQGMPLMPIRELVNRGETTQAAKRVASPPVHPAPADSVVSSETPSPPSSTVIPVAGFLEQNSKPSAQSQQSPRTGFASRETITDEPPPIASRKPESTLRPERTSLPTREYVVQAGDSLAEIARDQLGNPGRYRKIYDLNRDRLAGPNDLYIGMVLRLPVVENVSRSHVHDAPEFELKFAPIEPDDDGYTIVPARRSDAVPSDQVSEAQPAFIPARDTPYLPRAFRRSIDGPSAELPHHAH